MGALTRFALNNSMLLLLLVLFIVFAGPASFLSHPSREDPEITIRTALVTANFPGMAPPRVEDLITQKLEEKIREMPEVDEIKSSSRTGASTVTITLHDRFTDLGPIWQDLRNKMNDVKSELPDGTSGPFVNDTYGEVAMATIALTADGFGRAEMRQTARDLRNRLYTVNGVRKVELFGVEPERIFIEINNIHVAQLGIKIADVMQTVAKTNVISPGGRLQVGDNSIVVEPTGNFESIDDIRNVPIEIPNDPGRLVYLRDIATITRDYADPPEAPAFFNGRPAVVLSVQMVEQFDSFKFGDELKARVAELENGLPIGYQLSFITFQPKEIRTAVDGVVSNLYQTVAIVLIVVVLFLGWRTGLIVGSMVPLTMLMTLLIMRQVGIELERMSLASLIIALGLLVDNGIVMAEEIGRRMSLGEDRTRAAIDTGRTMALPLLASSLTTIFAFMPLMLSENAAGEYMRSLSLVIAIALLTSWVFAMTITPLFCVWGLKTPKPVDEDAAFDTRFYRTYRSVLALLLSFRLPFLAATVALLAVAVWGMQFVPKIFFPESDRLQLQVYVDLPVGSNTYGTTATTMKLATWLSDKDENPDIASNIAYVASGGPRFYLGLNPIDPDPHRAFLIVNVASADAVGKVRRHIVEYAAGNLPEARVSVKPMSMGSSEAGLVEYRITGPDSGTLYAAAEKLEHEMREIEGTVDIKNDWENRIMKVVVEIDQNRARRAGVTSESIANALNALLSGTQITDYREGDTVIPIYLRSEEDVRTNVDRLRTLNIAVSEEKPVALIQVANLTGFADFSVIKRRNMERVITVSGKNLTKSASALDVEVSEKLPDLGLPDGYRIEKGGEIESSGEAQQSLFANMPLAFALILIVLVGQFNSFIRPVIILAVIPLTLTGVTVALLVMPGANLSFVAILGLLSLAGIIINNAIVLIDRIDIERSDGLAVNEAILTASTKRLRPIVMTTVTTVLGLMPIIISRDVLFYDLAVVVSGGLILGTVLTLGVVPVLYGLFYQRSARREREAASAESPA
ncbi:multidrug efflux pump subunit AcrB [Rhodobium orientis]|uniref:Acriflavine resistance protein B n=1 Tax=Rhodobium orientis TaxID=34017 RepID=A0A327JMV6_9HYPH|nr:efflux RND transporter permease subunit [Rhodobium orientis]MBB4304896.1 multidrug efflux pump subunit AcrB [Rhodobium orientis]MBK5949225.1 hypothetical protein [Rhodobium orientis]RAI27391.1 hypothetical protein CH339_10675 [Rhodobium orientis]